MALDPRISLAAQAPNLQTSIRLFDDMKNSQLKRKMTEQQIKQSAEQFPLMQQQMQQGIDANTQGLQAGNQQQQINNENRVIQSIAEYAPTIKPLLEQAIKTGDTAAAQTALTKRLTGLMNQGLPTNETVDALTALRSGDIQETINYVDQASQIAQQRGLINNTEQQSVGQREYNDLLADFEADPKGLTPRGRAAGVKLRVLAPAGSSAQERILNSSSLQEEAVGFEADKAQAVSDVKVGEVLALEEKSKKTKQGIEQQRVNIDETKIKSAEKKEQVINQKNARRKEADFAVEQIGSLLSGDRFSNAFGKVVTTTPELLRSKESIDAIADVNQIKGLITLESRQKLKGQGTITDSEQKILAQSATVLDNPLISDDRARKELRKIKRVFEDASDRNQLKRETKDQIKNNQPSNEFAGFKVIR